MFKNLYKTTKNKVKKANPYTKLIICILTLGLMLRLVGGVNSILFTYDQTRDAIYSIGILHGQFKIVGPPSDVPGLFHGPLFYYIIGPAYFLAEGYPNLVYLEMILINILSAIPIFILVKKLFKNDQAATISVLLFSVSFEVVSYARWISNPALAIPAFAIVYLGLWMVINKEKYGWILLAAGTGVAIQSEVFLIYLIPFLALCLFIYKVKYQPRSLIIISALLFVLLITSYAVAELKFHFQGTTGLKSFLFSSLKDNSFNLANVTNYYTRLSSLFSTNLVFSSKIVSMNVSLAIFLIAAFSIFKNKYRKPLLFVYLIFFSSLSVFLISTFNAHFVTVGATIPFIILTSYAIWRLTLTNKIIGYLAIFILITANIATILKFNNRGNILFQIQDGMIFGDEIRVVQKTYEIAGSERFSIDAVTNPLFNPTSWAYLYQIYANKNHLTTPFYHGNSDPASTGYSILERSGEITKNEFTIIEPNLPEFWLKEILKFDDTRKPATYSTQIGLFKLVVRSD